MQSTLFLISIIASLLLLIFSQKVSSTVHSAHVHGEAELTIVIEENKLAVHFIIPAESLLGFEHSASSKSEIAAVLSVKEYLSHDNNVIQFTGGVCEIIDRNINTGDILSQHNHKDINAQFHSHNEISINYSYGCQNSNEISSASVHLIKHYERLKIISTHWVSALKQGSVRLNSSSSEVTFQ